MVCNSQLNDLIIMAFMYTGGEDYNSEPIIVKFDAGMISVPFSVSINEDEILEDNEMFNLTIDPASLTNNKITVGDPGQVTVTIVDNNSK